MDLDDYLMKPYMQEAKVIGKCPCCKEEIYEGYEYITYDDDLFVDEDHLMKFIGARWVS